MTLFRFEQDFAGSLRCVPMITRQKLDLVGIKLSLRQWSRMSHAERDRFVQAPCGTETEQDSYRQALLEVIALRSDEPARSLGSVSHDSWACDDRMPDCVIEQATRDGIGAPSAAQWAALTPLQRFALFKLARSEHENENFRPAMIEFGLLPEG